MIPKVDLNLHPSSDTVICSLAIGEHQNLLNLMKPTVDLYANTHGFDTVFVTYPLTNRPVAWDKVVLIRKLLDDYSLVIWMDADTMIVNPRQNIKDDLDSNYDMHLCTHKGVEPCCPNTGVWVVKKTARSIQILEDIWNQTDYIPNHPWEQGALFKLLGYPNPRDFFYYVGPTEYTHCIKTLDIKYNSMMSWGGFLGASSNPVIVHHCGVPLEERLTSMQESYNLFLQNKQ
ncbi:DUF273 domain-containing protein [Sporolactobacillus shoreae]|uniref:DUF273 domain-containing protein n=1 Tax=Sporolactobacillus shoreae TaxID=1465501 RepID=A0A4Z0GPW7_9BACL|nr:DUF273 domain-containing protein [Sporolactobacillus shoreae]TGA98716.1 DUF273 domain-containing protein [Sporolactobacillus shoreae]